MTRSSMCVSKHDLVLAVSLPFVFLLHQLSNSNVLAAPKSDSHVPFCAFQHSSSWLLWGRWRSPRGYPVNEEESAGLGDQAIRRVSSKITRRDVNSWFRHLPTTREAKDIWASVHVHGSEEGETGLNSSRRPTIFSPSLPQTNRL